MNTDLPHQKRSVWKAILPGLVILVAGIAIGVSATLIVTGGPHDTGEPEPEEFAEQMLRRLTRELDLTARQREQLEPILQDHYRALRDIRTEARPRIVAQLIELDDEVANVLDEDQARRWREKLDRLDEHFPTFRERRRAGEQGRGPGFRTNQRGPHGPREPLNADCPEDAGEHTPDDEP